MNADLIAVGLSRFDPGAAAIRAGRMMLNEIDRHAAQGRSFAFETTFAGHTCANRIAMWRAHGFVEVYRQKVDFRQWYDNSGLRPRLLKEGRIDER